MRGRGRDGVGCADGWMHLGHQHGQLGGVANNVVVHGLVRFWIHGKGRRLGVVHLTWTCRARGGAKHWRQVAPEVAEAAHWRGCKRCLEWWP